MALVINTNIASLVAQRNLAVNNSALSKSVQRLSSGLRINSAADDAAGLSISEKLTAQIRSIAVAVRNSQDGVSLSQVAEGGLTEIGSILTRMRELAEQSSNGTLGTSERSALDNEYSQLISEIDRISNVTEFNGIKLLDGSQSSTGVTLQVGFQNTANDRINFFSGVAATDTANLGITGAFATISSAGNAQSALTQIDAAISTVALRRGTLGAIQNRLDSTVSNLRVASENLTAANSRIRDADFAYETAQFTKNQILVQAATSILAQANVLPQNALQLLR
ncbi:MAG: flagellin [Nitrospirota bacterium]|nr:flagellin [Nitrospirota bacterium]